MLKLIIYLKALCSNNKFLLDPLIYILQKSVHSSRLQVKMGDFDFYGKQQKKAKYIFEEASWFSLVDFHSNKYRERKREMVIKIKL